MNKLELSELAKTKRYRLYIEWKTNNEALILLGYIDNMEIKVVILIGYSKDFLCYKFGYLLTENLD